MRRRTDISGSRMYRFAGIAKPSAMGLLLSSGHNLELNGVTRRCCHQDTPARRTRPTTTHTAMPLSTRTSIDSPGLITSVGYILIAGRSAAAQHGEIGQGAAVGSKLAPVSSYPAGPVSLRETLRPITREIEWEGKCAISTGRCNVLRIGPLGGALPRELQRIETDTRTFSTGPPASALTTRPPNSTVTVVGIGIGDGGGGGVGGGQLSAVASNAGDDARTNRDEAKMSQHVPAP